MKLKKLKVFFVDSQYGIVASTRIAFADKIQMKNVISLPAISRLAKLDVESNWKNQDEISLE